MTFTKKILRQVDDYWEAKRVKKEPVKKRKRKKDKFKSTEGKAKKAINTKKWYQFWKSEDDA